MDPEPIPAPIVAASPKENGPIATSIPTNIVENSASNQVKSEAPLEELNEADPLTEVLPLPIPKDTPLPASPPKPPPKSPPKTPPKSPKSKAEGVDSNAASPGAPSLLLFPSSKSPESSREPVTINTSLKSKDESSDSAVLEKEVDSQRARALADGRILRSNSVTESSMEEVPVVEGEATASRKSASSKAERLKNKTDPFTPDVSRSGRKSMTSSSTTSSSTGKDRSKRSSLPAAATERAAKSSTDRGISNLDGSRKPKSTLPALGDKPDSPKSGQKEKEENQPVITAPMSLEEKTRGMTELGNEHNFNSVEAGKQPTSPPPRRRSILARICCWLFFTILILTALIFGVYFYLKYSVKITAVEVAPYVPFIENFNTEAVFSFRALLLVSVFNSNPWASRISVQGCHLGLCVTTVWKELGPYEKAVLDSYMTVVYNQLTDPTGQHLLQMLSLCDRVPIVTSGTTPTSNIWELTARVQMFDQKIEFNTVDQLAAKFQCLIPENYTSIMMKNATSANRNKPVRYIGDVLPDSDYEFI